MECPQCSQSMTDVTDSWHSFAEAEGAEYLATYVTIWHCSACETVAGVDQDRIEWLMEKEGALNEE